MMNILRHKALLAFLACSMAAAVNADAVKRIDVPAGDLLAAIETIEKQADVEIVYQPEKLKGLKTAGVSGNLTTQEAVRKLLEGTRLRLSTDANTGAMLIGSAAASKPTASATSAAAMNLAQVDPMASSLQKVDTVDETAQTSQGQSEEGEEMLVTGSRIVRAASQMAADVIVLDAQTLKATGESTLEGALRQLPQNMFGASRVGAATGQGPSFNGAKNITGGATINLRGLGAESTLVLLDGRRIGKSGVFGGVSDITGIPLASVDRVEIMLDGASALYGSDAVGGVVNIITRKDYNGAEFNFQYGRPQEGGFEESIFTASAGRTFGFGRLRGTFEHFKSTNLDGGERPENVSYSTLRNPAGLVGFGSVYLYQGQYYLSTTLPSGITPASPGVQAVAFRANLPVGQDGTDLALDDFALLTGGLPDQLDPDASEGISLIPPQERDTLQLGFDREFRLFGSAVTFGADAYYSERSTYAADGAFTFAGFLPAGASGQPYYNPMNFALAVNWRIPGFADRHHETEQEVMRGSMGLNGSFGSRWNWSAGAGVARDDIASGYFNRAIPATYFTQALIDLYRSFGVEPNLTYTNLVNSGLNLLASDIVAANPADMLAQLVVPRSHTRARNIENTAEFKTDGRLWRLPGGESRLAFGIEWRQEKLTSFSDLNLGMYQYALSSNEIGAVGTGSVPQFAYPETEVGRTQRSGFAEVLIPLVGKDNAMTGVRQLLLTGSGRYDSYREQGDGTTWSAGAIWSPVDSLLVRANRSTSYVVPTFRDQLSPTVIAPQGLYAELVDANGNFTGEPPELISRYIGGGNPDLKPETADTISTGLEWRPPLLPGLTLKATWHDTQYHDRIGAAPEVVELQYLPPTYVLTILSGSGYETKYGSSFYRDTDGSLVQDGRSVNTSLVEMSGIDYQLRYDLQSPFGRWILTTNIGRTLKYQSVLHPGDTPVNQVANVGFESRTVVPAYRYNMDLAWYRGGWSASVNLDTASRTVSTGLSSNGMLSRISKPALDTTLSLTYDFEQAASAPVPAWLGRSAFSLQVLNLLDARPQYDVVWADTGLPSPYSELNANVADPRGACST